MSLDALRLKDRIPIVDLPDGYRGKILLVLVQYHGEEIIILRSGDLWHREILRNTRTELIEAGLPDAEVEQLGGTFLYFSDDGSIEIGGPSEDFGTCDLEFAAVLIRSAWPNRTVSVHA